MVHSPIRMDGAESVRLQRYSWMVIPKMFVVCLALAAVCAAQTPAPAPPLPDLHQLMRAVMDHQKQLEAVRENYTFTSLVTTQEMDAAGQVKKTESEESEEFFVNGHMIDRTVKKDGKPLSAGDEQKETERVTKLVEKAQKVPYGQQLQGAPVSVSRLLDLMDLHSPRRMTFRGRPTIVFDFIGRKDAKTHGMVEDASKKLQGTIWIDEADMQVAHLEVNFDDNFRVAGGMFATIDKGSKFSFDQALVSSPGDKNPLWMPTRAEASLQGRVLLLKNLHQHFVERDTDYKTFHVETGLGKDAEVLREKAR
jgi:hypothetical protein